MYYKQLSWLDQVNLDCKVEALRKQLKSKKVILCHISHEINRLMNSWSTLMCEKHRVHLLHAELDLQLAQIDGRLEVIKDVPKIIKKELKVKSALEALTDEERRILILELSTM